MSEDDEDEDELEKFWYRIENEARTVYSRYWKSHWTNDRELEEEDTIVQLDNDFYTLVSYEDDLRGPFRTVEAAVLAGDLDKVDEDTFEIDAPGMDDELLQALLIYKGVLKHTLIINGKKWKTKAGGKLAPVPDIELRYT